VTPEREAKIRKMLISEDVEIVELFVGIEDLLAEIDSLRERIIALSFGLETYGQHTVLCASHLRIVEPYPECSCGLSKLLEEK